MVRSFRTGVGTECSVQDTSAEPYFDPEEALLWRCRPVDRLQSIQEPKPRKSLLVFTWLYFLAGAAIMLLLAWIFASLEFPGHMIIAIPLAVLSVLMALSTIATPIISHWNRLEKIPLHTDYILTSHRFMVLREGGTSLSIYPDAIISIESLRVPIGYHVVLHLLSGEGPFQEELKLSRFRLAESENLEKRLIEWKNKSLKVEHYEQTH